MKPSHLTFTGVDSFALAHELTALSRDFPIEWGVLFHPTAQGEGRFAPLSDIQSLLKLDLRYAAHLCGGYARDAVDHRPLSATMNSLLGSFQRIQINTANRRAAPDSIAKFCARFKVRGILQCRGADRFPSRSEVDWLFDRSGGKGLVPDRWPIPSPESGFVGYSGGLGPDTIEAALADILEQHPESMPFWLDMESAIRTDDRFDLAKCRRVCEIVYG